MKSNHCYIQGVHSGSHDDEAYIYLTYGTVEYHKLLSQVSINIIMMIMTVYKHIAKHCINLFLNYRECPNN